MKEQIEKQAIDEIDSLTTVLYEANHKKSVLDYHWLATEAYNTGWRKQEWISVDDRLPEYGGMYLVYNPQRMVTKVVTARYSKDTKRWCSADACCYHEGITHWMPLPEPPKMKGGAE